MPDHLFTGCSSPEHSSTIQTAIIKDIKGMVCEWLDCMLMNNGIAIGEPMSRSPYSNWIQAAWTFGVS